MPAPKMSGLKKGLLGGTALVGVGGTAFAITQQVTSTAATIAGGAIAADLIKDILSDPVKMGFVAGGGILLIMLLK